MIKKQYKYFIEIEKVPAYAIISLKHNTYLYESELKTTSELIEEIRNNQNWDHFLAKTEA
jgi:hypothetical protein